MNIKMKSKLTLITFLLALTLFNCNKQNAFSDYKYADKPEAIICKGLNSKLYNEALYSFEDDILKFYQQKKSNTTLVQGYSQFIRAAIYSTPKFEEIVTCKCRFLGDCTRYCYYNITFPYLETL